MRFFSLCFLFSLSAHAGFDPFADTRAPRRFAIPGPDGSFLVLKGGFEVSWLNLEGEGGAGKDSATDTLTLGTRSGHLRLDRVRLAPRLETGDGLRFFSELNFDPRGAHARAAWMDGVWPLGQRAELHVELGFQRPFVSVDPGTRRAPLTARSWWGASEVHAVVEAKMQWGQFRIDGGLSAAMMRPLTAVSVNDASDRGTLAVLAAGTAKPFSGNAPVLGARLGLGWRWIHLETFGFVGELASEGGIDPLRNRIAAFELLPGFNRADPRDQDSRYWWAGGRLDVEGHGAHLRLEAIEGRESLLRRGSAYAQAGYSRWGVELRTRVERYRIADAGKMRSPKRSLRAADLSQALTWDWDILTVGLAGWIYRDLVRLTVEHSRIGETNGNKIRAEQPFKNDETTAQLELRF